MFSKMRTTAALVLALCMMSVLPAANATGKSDNAVPVTMTANKAALQSSVPTDIAVYAKVDIVFKKGAEGSTVTTRKDGASANVQNKTKGQVELIGKTGSATMETGDRGTVSDGVKDETVSGSTGSDNKVSGSAGDQDNPGGDVTEIRYVTVSAGQSDSAGQEQGAGADQKKDDSENKDGSENKGDPAQPLTDGQAAELLGQLQELAEGDQLVSQGVDSIVSADPAAGGDVAQGAQEWKPLTELQKERLLGFLLRSIALIRGQVPGTDSGADAGNADSSAGGAADLSGEGTALFGFVGDHLVFLADTPVELTVHDSLSLVSFGEGAEGSVIILDEGVQIGTLVLDGKGITVKGDGIVGNLILSDSADAPDKPDEPDSPPVAAAIPQNQHRHIPGEWVIVSEVPATYSEGGSVTMIQYCADENCGQQIDINTYPTDPLPLPDSPAEPVVASAPAAPAECVHDWENTGNFVVGDEFSCISYKCKKCGATKEERIEMGQ